MTPDIWAELVKTGSALVVVLGLFVWVIVYRDPKRDEAWQKAIEKLGQNHAEAVEKVTKHCDESMRQVLAEFSALAGRNHHGDD